MAIESAPLVTLSPHRWTTDEYYRMAELGILEPDARVELIEGVIVDMAPIGPGHSGHVNRGTRVFSRALGDRVLLSVQNAVHLALGSDPEPDLALLRPRADDYIRSQPTPADILLIVEVADSSLKYDREVKGPLYAQAGIADYWIVNLVESQVEVHRQPTPDGYGSVQAFRAGDTIPLLAFPDVSIAVADILG